MPKLPRMFNEDRVERIANFLSSGEDPRGYFHSVETLYALIRKKPDITQEFKEELVQLLERDLVKGSRLVDAFQLGIFMGAHYSGQPSEELDMILAYINNLDNLPFVNIRGEPVH